MILESLIADAGGVAAVLTRAADLAGVAAVIGACAFRFAVLRSGSGTPSHGATAADSARFGAAGAALVMAAVAGRIVAQAQAFLEPGEPLLPVLGTVAGTGWGMAATLQLVAAAVALTGFVVAAKDRWKTPWMRTLGWCLAIAGGTATACTIPFLGHAAAMEAWRTVGISVDMAHVIAAGGWAGAVGVLAWVVSRPGLPADNETVATLIERFRPLALGSAALLVASGMTSTWLHVGGITALVTSTYGRLLMAKLAAVFVAAALGRIHSLSAARDVRAGRRHAVARSIGAEVIVMLVVFSLTALLTGSPLPGE